MKTIKELKAEIQQQDKTLKWKIGKVVPHVLEQMQNILKEIKKLKFTGPIKAIDYETDLAYRKGYNQAIKDVEELING